MAFEMGYTMDGSSGGGEPGVTVLFGTGSLDAAGLYGFPLVAAGGYEILGTPWFTEAPAPETGLTRVSGIDDDHIWIQAADGGIESAGLGVKFAYIAL